MACRSANDSEAALLTHGHIYGKNISIFRIYWNGRNRRTLPDWGIDMNFRYVFAAFLFWLSAAAMGQAATLSASGATGVEVNGTLYDVEFVDGSCVNLFDGCDETSDFLFPTVEDANAASQSLLELFNAPGNEAFTEDPSLTRGCPENATFCQILTPYDVTSIDFALSRTFDNSAGATSDSIGSFSFVFADDRPTEPEFPITYAVWSSPVPIPVPASFPLLAFGLAGFAGLSWRKNWRAQV